MRKDKKNKKIVLRQAQHNPEWSRRIVCLGGGNAMPKAVLAGLKKYPVKLSVICAMLDSGGSAGRLRKDYNIISPGDIRRAFIALADTSPAVESLLNYRFETGELKGHNFANLLITTMELANQDYEKTFEEMSQLLNINTNHEVLPVTLDNANLHAVLENGKVISGETNIDIPKHDGNLRIKKAFLKPRAKAYPRSLEAISQADLIVIGPGDLYSSLAQILLTEGIPGAIKKSNAKKVYICNLMTKYGETNNFSVLDFTQEIEKYIGGAIDYVIYNNKQPSAPSLLTIYKKKHPELLGLVKINENLPKEKFIGRNLLKTDSIEHDPKKVSKTLISLCKR
ncbi:MAG: hypothetical protein CO031_01470 [Candidatus Nealsonbacteria bacterium CG_4_9_14_0_2_um_filter_37_38]|uniref:Gluconeogenesis factor n=1 Tax=Candidatus Nealsonbacteria bacterium CG_4_10_14_0_8_um_filter_37_14 TaxID=1974684 RepID=A0A2M7R7M6_9BACT|nr:MAG: hypothetical protein COV63_00965 [Candidatus Nealsonbacteria bacterium CG11_big_fil_rev_8_21_14_0_20_37_68]PIY89169.1 MAG: hypothetical protein COY73_01765 [Candidatus Nealsonbacteria bacterium CG_4_10_14_0_8_um_filter_37_14]PJC51700.1 MAG: hypothetical protein CO031_01470 [Candidatus Nealsonbacteria bacterium CG_4_9_14_0_2_um_filter_37_38]